MYIPIVGGLTTTKDSLTRITALPEIQKKKINVLVDFLKVSDLISLVL